MLGDLRKANPQRNSEDDTRIGGAEDSYTESNVPNASDNNNDGLRKSILQVPRDNLQSTDLTGNRANTSRTSLFRSDFNEEMIFSKYTMYWVHKENQKVYDLMVELPHYATVKESIGELIRLYNEKFSSEGVSLFFTEDSTLFQLYAAKKSGHPKLDYPAYDAAQVVVETGVTSFSLVENDPRALRTYVKKGNSGGDLSLKASRQSEEIKSSSNTPAKLKLNSSVIEPSQPQQQPNPGSMANPEVMSQGGMTHISLAHEPEYENTTYCCCFTSRKLKPMSYGITMSPNANSGVSTPKNNTNPNPNQLNNPLLGK